ncbi:MAG: hypothetical protein QXQ14_02130 [Candidatus Aenigmatarchaeota archaeon]
MYTVERIGSNLTKINENIFLLKVVGKIGNYKERKIREYLNLNENPIVISSLSSYPSIISSTTYYRDLLSNKLRKEECNVININLKPFKVIEVLDEDNVKFRVFEIGSIAYVSQDLSVLKDDYIAVKINPFEIKEISEHLERHLTQLLYET